MKRLLLNFFSAASFLGCALMLALWVRSDRIDETFTRAQVTSFDVTTPGPRVGIVVEQITLWNTTVLRSAGGKIRLNWTSTRDDPRRNGDRPAFIFLMGDVVYESTPIRSRTAFFGETYNTVAGRLGFDPGDWTWSETERSASFPIWLVVIMTAILPGTRLIAIYRRRQSAGARCVRCGYDLRATPQRCPECGTVAQIVESGRSQVG